MRFGLRMGTVAVAIVAAAGACGGAEVALSPAVKRPSADVQHRPPWLSWITTADKQISLCLEGREAPAYVLLVYRGASGLTVVSTVDAFRAIEHCGVDGSRVVLRQPARQQLSAYDGMPLFSLGPARPHVSATTPMEEVVSEQRVLGWVHWPPSSPEPATTVAAHTGDPESDVELP
jgi:hypothetical protein